ncbi:nuclear receptor corepressor 2-like isoform X2 [Paramacrobiotus metropolitanus]|uniref:nuclear receptor corepressor 2-like isoform X2 n=1 Tax=Paramacrobiotus metropolitanus TaxID=2943436 RepID=UPI002445B39F|nr:nuclear receptor corepressor 2-like isoform X2 [Paramacrobiotus metropolitanus]
MNPAYYRTASSPHGGHTAPPQSSRAEHPGAPVPVPFPMQMAGMALPMGVGYPQYAAAAQAEMMHRLQQASSFGFLHPHQAAHFYPGAGSPYLNPDTSTLLMPPARSVSPPRRAPPAAGDREPRDRYLRTISPNESRSPGMIKSGGSGGHQYTRPASPPRREVYADARGGYTLKKEPGYPPPQQQRGSVDPYLRPGSGSVLVKHESAPRSSAAEYAPRLEAISPPSDENSELDKKCQAVESEIRALESTVHTCEKNIDQWQAELAAAEAKKEDYERQRKSQAETARPNSPESEVNSADMLRRIIAENRRIAESEHGLAGKRFGIVVTASTHNHHPSSFVDVVLASNYQKQRAGIILRLKKDRQAKQIRERYLKERYKQLSQAYLSRLEKTEGNPKKRTREAKMREYYERQFPEIRKNREDKLRDLRMNRAKGDPEPDLSNLDENDMEKYYRNAVLVPMLLDAKDRSRHFYDRNRLVENPARDYKESVSNCFWTQEEKDIFKDKYLQRPKDFGYISSFLKRKSTQDCIQYYYLTKRKENYKQMVKKQKAFRMRRGPNKRLQSLEEPVTPSKMALNTSLLSNSIMDVDENIQAITLTILCPARKCQAGRRAIKRLFKTPSEFPNFAHTSRRLELPDTATSCCKYCIAYIERRLGLGKWNDGEVELLKKALLTHGTNWTAVSKALAPKRVRDCIQYYRGHAMELGLLSLPPPDLLAPHDDEFSPWTTSSSDDDEDEPVPIDKVADASPVRPDAGNPPLIRSHSVDSNATLSADEVDTEEDTENTQPPPRPLLAPPAPHQYLAALPRAAAAAHSFSPSQLPVPAHMDRRRSPLPPGQAPQGGNGPACVRDLIHHAIEKNLDKDRPGPPSNPVDFKRQLESQVQMVHKEQRRGGVVEGGEVPVAVLARTSQMVDSDTRMTPHLLIPRGTGRESAKSPGETEGARRSQAQAYQYSTRQNLLTDFATSRQLHAEQEGKGRGPSQPSPYTSAAYDTHPMHVQSAPQVTQPDPRFVQLYSPYVAYLPPGGGLPYNMVTPEYMEQLAAAGFPPVGLGAASMMPALMAQGGQQQRGMPQQQQQQQAPPQRSITLGTGRPGLPGEESERENASRDRMQTLAANRGLLRESEKRGKPEVITIDETRRDQTSPGAGQDMKFYPAAGHHALMKGGQEGQSAPHKGGRGGAEPNPNLTAGSLIDVIITRQIGTRPGQQPPGPEQNAANSLSVVAGGNAHLQHPLPTAAHQHPHMSSGSSSRKQQQRRDEEALAALHNKPFTLGEHIEQIIANDFSRKDAPGPPPPMELSGRAPHGRGQSPAAAVRQSAAHGAGDGAGARGVAVPAVLPGQLEAADADGRGGQSAAAGPAPAAPGAE